MATNATISEKFQPISSSISSNTQWMLKPKDIIIGQEIGRGTFGVVYKGKLYNMDVAIKKPASSASPDEVQGAAAY
jgi:predicted Ser/Thr protein kinase